MSVTAYPLVWPYGWPRTPSHKRVSGKSRWQSGGKPWTFDAARKALADEIERLGASNVVLSTNYELRLDGAPRAGAPKPNDVGIAVYFSYKGRQVAMARDAFDRAEENIRSLTLASRAMRAIEEHGGSLMMDRAFEGFMALPAPGSKRPWREVFGFGPSEKVQREELLERYRSKAKSAHPDAAGGSHDLFTELNAAKIDAIRELGL
jgi:hypothetical protein